VWKKLGIKTAENWYSHLPKAVCEYEYMIILWNQGVQTDAEGLANRPDIIIKTKSDKICLLIDVALPSDRNVIQKEAEKKLKYKNSSVETHCMWDMKCFIIPVFTGITETVTK
jgi:hypothetical protein